MILRDSNVRRSTLRDRLPLESLGVGEAFRGEYACKYQINVKYSARRAIDQGRTSRLKNSLRLLLLLDIRENRFPEETKRVSSRLLIKYQKKTVTHPQAANYTPSPCHPTSSKAPSRSSHSPASTARTRRSPYTSAHPTFRAG